MLSNLWSGIKNVASSIGSFLSGSNTATASKGMEFPLLPGVNPVRDASGLVTLKPTQTIAPTMTVAPTATDPGGPGVGGISYNNPAMQLKQTQAAQQASAMPYNSEPLRPSTYTKPIDQYGRESTKAEGVPFVNAKGNLVIPKTGFTGLSGAGGSGLTSQSTPATGLQGTSGMDARGYRSAGQGTTSALFNQPTSDENSRSKQAQDSQLITTAPTASALAALQANAQEAQIPPPPVLDIIDAGFIASTRDALNKTLSSNLSEQDKQTVYAQLQQNLLAAKQKLDQASPIPEMPVVDTADQLAFLEQSGDPFGVKNAMDQFRAEQTNLSQLQTTRVELMKNVQALNEAYAPIMKEIKQNPNMPKALARRKIEALAVTQKETMQGFLDQLEIVGQQISDQNEIVNRAFNIITLAESSANRAQDNARANLQMMVNSGAIAGFSAADMQRYSQLTGIPVNSIKKMQAQALEPKTTQETRNVDGKVVHFVYNDKGQVISSQVLGSDGTGGSGGNVSSVGAILTPYLKDAIDAGLSGDSAVLDAIEASGIKLTNAERAAMIELTQKLQAQKIQTETAAQDPVTAFLFNSSMPSTRTAGSTAASTFKLPTSEPATTTNSTGLNFKISTKNI